MEDYCFLRFIDNFDKAKSLGNNDLAKFKYDSQIHLNPTENYSIITNVNTGISFNNNFKVYLVNCDNDILNEITEKIFIEEFTHNETGLKQCKIEILQLNLDYITDLVYIRLDHTIVGGISYWSNPFIISEYDINETKRFDFKNYRNLDGTCYEVASIYQSIRLKCIKLKNTFTSTSESYTAMEGFKLTSSLTKTKFHEYLMEMNNDFIYDRMQYLLSHDIIYIDNIRITDKQTYENDDKYSNSTNVSQNKFKVAVDVTDVYNYEYQIFEEFNVINKIPEGNLSIANYNTITSNSTSYKLSFNKPITSIDNSIFGKLYKDNVLFGLFDHTKFTISGNDVLINVSSFPVTQNGYYYLTIQENVILSNTEKFQGFSENKMNFTISDGDYNSDDYDNNDYNT